MGVNHITGTSLPSPVYPLQPNELTPGCWPGNTHGNSPPQKVVLDW